MLINWIFFLTALVGCLFFLFFYYEWVAWVTLVCVALLPLLSLILSLPVMVSTRIQSRIPASVTVGSKLQLDVTIKSLFPMPPHKFWIRTENLLTGERRLLSKDLTCPTHHCGALECRFVKSRIHDYLGLFRLPLRNPGSFRILVMPLPVEPDIIPDTTQLTGNAWRPKPGGGFAENSELRNYQPGDNLRQIHWKLSAKTGDLILREPMIPVEFNLLLWFRHCGSPEVMHRKLGNLLWLSDYLLHHRLAHDVMAFTDDDIHVWHIALPEDLNRAVEDLLCIRPSEPQHEVIPPERYHWQYCIGGDNHAE